LSNYPDQFEAAEIQISFKPFFWVYLAFCTIDLAAIGVSIHQQEIF